MPAPTLQAQGAIAAVTTGDLTVTLPAYAANDIVVITTVGYVPNTTTGTNTQTLASPWNKNSPNVTTGNPIDEEHATWWARATSASSLGTTVTITRPTSWDTGADTCWAGRAYVVRGCVTTGNPYDEFASTALSTAANPALPAITVSGGNRLAIVFMTKADNSATPTAATGYTVGTEVTTNTGTDAAFQSYRQTASATVSTVTPTGGTAPAQGNSAYFEFSFIPESVTATASAPLGGTTGTATALVSHTATASAPLGATTGTATATVTKPTVFATAAAPLGALTATATADVTRPPVTATASAPLGTLSSTASAVVSHNATATSSLGAVTSTATAVVTHDVTASAPLGAVIGTANAIVNNLVNATAALGTLASTATADVSHDATADAPLGSVTATATAQIGDVATATSQLGALTATATATVTPGPTPPSKPSTGGRRDRFDIRPERPTRIPKIEPKPRPGFVVAYGLAYLTSVQAQAEGIVTYVAENDDEEVLLLLTNATRLRIP